LSQLHKSDVQQHLTEPTQECIAQENVTSPAWTKMPARFAWMLLGVLFAGSVLNYLDRAVLGVVMPQVRHSLSLTNSDYGLVVNAFLFCYMIFYVVGGRISDRLGCRSSFAVNVIAWSAASMLQALARGLISLCFFRGLLGAAEGGFYPTAVRGVSDWFSPANRAKAIGILLCGLSVGSLLAPPIVAALTVRFGWRAAFIVTGALGFLLLPAWHFLHRHAEHFRAEPVSTSALKPGSQPVTQTSVSIVQGAMQKKYLLLLAARSITDAVWFFCLFWIPGYFQEARGFNLAEIGRWLWIPYLSGDIGALAGTWVSSLLMNRGLTLDRARKAVMLPSALLGICGAGTYFLEGHFASLTALSIALFGIFSWAGNLQTAITEIVPPQHVAVLYGVTGATGTLTAALSQLLIGRVVDRSGYEFVFLGLGTGLLLALGLVFAAGKILLWQPAVMEPARSHNTKCEKDKKRCRLFTTTIQG
jgi:MFS transporter, ACS family, hexuronate transporter